MQKQVPSFKPEEQYWQQGITLVAGIDEAGMGALAGPVVAGAVIFRPGTIIEGLRDSKKLSEKQRETLVPIIKHKAFTCAVGMASIEEIFTLNIRRAAHLAMRRAIEQLSVTPEILFIDGNPANIHDQIPAVSYVKGDNISCSIAAASILAKVHRDDLMRSIHEKFPAYDFCSNKGYGSQSHLTALANEGTCPHHRAGYKPIADILTKITQPSTIQT